MRLKPIIEELRAHCPVFDGNVFGVAEYAQIEESIGFDLPAAFVLPISEDPEEPATVNRYMQDVEFAFAVAVLVSTASQEEGIDAWDVVDAIKLDLFAALLGCDADDQSDWIEYEGLTITQVNRAFLAVQFNFRTYYEITDQETRHGFDIERLGRFKRMHVAVDLNGDDLPEAQAKVNLKD